MPTLRSASKASAAVVPPDPPPLPTSSIFTQRPPPPNMEGIERSERHPSPDASWEPCYMFFYGSLMDPDVLSQILMLDNTTTPELKPAILLGYTMRLWGSFPTLIPSDAIKRTTGAEEHASRTGPSEVKGFVYWLESEKQFKRLQRYESQAYRWDFTAVRLLKEDGGAGEKLEGVRTFVWARDVQDEDLDEGTFDLVEWQNNSKAMFFTPRKRR